MDNQATQDNAKRGAFEYQLEMLKLEIEVTNTTIRQIDDISKSFKEWTITIWAASVGGALVTPGLDVLMWTTAAIPLLFWIVDSYHHVIQRRFIWRSLTIMDFLNDERLVNSFIQQRLVGFAVMDVADRRNRTKKQKAFTSWSRVLFFRTMSIFYVGLMVMSLVIWCLRPVGVQRQKSEGPNNAQGPDALVTATPRP